MLEFSMSERLYTMIFRASNQLIRNFRGVSNIPPGQLRLLAICRAIENPTQQKLLNILQIRPASLSEMLTKLEKNGYIVRTRDEKDKRNVIISLTEKSALTAQENYNVQREKAMDAFSSLDETEKEQLFTILKKLVETWEENEI